MNPERWQKVKDLFTASTGLSDSARERFLTEQTAGDMELRHEVESLLASSAPVEDDEAFGIAPFLNAETSSLIGTSIGAYKVVREIARGGMGVVYEGIRETEFNQRVAIKLIRSGLGTDETVRRFRAERSALARLNHPNIAKLLDGGSLPDARLPDGQGTPYFIMEYVDGVPLDAYCDEHKLSIQERLGLFRSVCAAVHYAHQNLIVHRDLKPGNIFVTANARLPDGQGVKLLDFGIAKLLTTDSSDASIAQTQHVGRFLTPEYASPEQILGTNVTTASDTYSLGVLLYKLLTGQRPYRFKSPALRDVERAIIENQPTKPSSAVIKAEAIVAENRSASISKLGKTLSGDLDTIVLKALQKEPERRYSSVQQFDEDIRRHLSGLPVIARKDSPRYRFSKFVGRNRIAVAASIAVFVLLVAGIASSLWQAQRAERERDRAQAETEKAKQVISVLKDIFSSADRSRATKNDVTVAEVLEHASQRIEKDFANQPEIAADVLSTIGSTYEGLGIYDKAKTTMLTALRLQELSHGNDHPDVAEALHALGMIHHMNEDRAAAESLYNRSLTIFRRFKQPSSEYATTLNDYAVFVQDQEKYSLADSLLRTAIEMYEALPADNRRQLASSLHNLALNYDWLGQLSLADSLYRESLLLQREVYGGENAQMASTIGNMGFIAEARHDYVEAERLFREALAIRRTLLDENHNLVTANKIKLGLFLLDHTSGSEEPERLCREALTAVLRTNPELKRLVARAHLGIGRAVGRKGKKQEAEREFREAIASFMLAQPVNAKHIAEAEVFLAQNLIEQKRFREAEAQLLRTREKLKTASADSSEEMQRATKTLGDLYSTWRRK